MRESSVCSECSLAFSSKLHRKQTVAERIATRRWLQQQDPSTTSSRVVYRNPSGIAYSSCAYLDEHDTVLAMDSNGYLDIVRLHRRNNHQPHHQEDPSFSTNEESTLGGTALCTQLSVTAATRNENHRCHLDFRARSKCQLFGMRDSFAVAFPNGEFRIFATETSKLQWENAKLGLEDIGCSSSSSSSFRASPFVTRGWKAREPLRSTTSGGTFESRCLAEQLLWSTTTTTRNDSNFQPFDSTHRDPWRSDSGSSSCSFVVSDRVAVWDVWSKGCNAAALLAVQIDQGTKHPLQETFCLRILDERLPQTKHAMCVDLPIQGTRKNDPSNNHQNHMNGVCFVHDRMVATSTDHGLVQLWDIRRMHNDSAASVLSSFPQEATYGMQSSRAFCPIRGATNTTTTNTSRNPTHHRNPSLGHSNRLCRLSNGNLLLTQEGSTVYQDHVVVHPFQERVVATLRTPTNDNGCWAVNPQSGTIASYCSTKDTIQFVPARRPRDGRNSGSSKPKKNKKRKVHECGSSDSSQDILPAGITDRDSLQSELSSMAFNASGTGLLGATTDGDIYVWQS